MKSKLLIFSTTFILLLSLFIASVAFASSLPEENSPDCTNSITINKVTEPAGGTGFNFTLVRPGYNKSFTLDDGGTKTYNPNSWSVFTLTETPKPDYHLKSISCTGPTKAVFTYDLANSKVTIDLSKNVDGAVTCTFTNVKAMDYGDLPDFYTGLTNWISGARHSVVDNSIRLGTVVDNEWDGQPNTAANGDDTNGTPNDEDGVVRGPDSWGNGSGQVLVTVTDPTNSGKEGCLMGWLDYYDLTNHDFGPDYQFTDSFTISEGTFSEKIIDNLYVPAGTTPITFPLPSGFKNTGVFARFRLSPYISAKDKTGDKCNQTPAGLTGFVAGGEVEDYFWLFGPTAIQLQSFKAQPVQTSRYAGPIVALLAILATIIFWTFRRRAHS